MIGVTKEKILIKEVFGFVGSSKAGAVVPFFGVVRDDDGITGLHYECYPAMAEKILQSIANETKKRWSVQKVAIVHRYGWVPVGEASVVIAVSSAHRKEAFEACRFVIDTLKREAPIWKIEEGKHAACC